MKGRLGGGTGDLEEGRGGGEHRSRHEMCVAGRAEEQSCSGEMDTNNSAGGKAGLPRDEEFIPVLGFGDSDLWKEDYVCVRVWMYLTETKCVCFAVVQHFSYHLWYQ